MTPEEEALLRAACREALELGPSAIVFVGAEDEDQEALVFRLAHFEEQDAIGIILPRAWESLPDMNDRCNGILSQEEKALDGQALD